MTTPPVYDREFAAFMLGVIAGMSILFVINLVATLLAHWLP